MTVVPTITVDILRFTRRSPCRVQLRRGILSTSVKLSTYLYSSKIQNISKESVWFGSKYLVYLISQKHKSFDSYTSTFVFTRTKERTIRSHTSMCTHLLKYKVPANRRGYLTKGPSFRVSLWVLRKAHLHPFSGNLLYSRTL